YDLHNPYLNIKKAKLEIVRRFDNSPVWERELEDDELLDGDHNLEFGMDYSKGHRFNDWGGGGLDETKRFPDGYLTVEHSPYKLRLTVEGPGRSSAHMAWTYFHVLIHH